VGETPVEQIPLPGIGLDYPGAQLDGVGEGGDVAAPLGQGQGGADPERQAVQERGEPIEINPSAIRLGMTVSLSLKNFKRTPPAASCGVLN
jgi:hypothetical protein